MKLFLLFLLSPFVLGQTPPQDLAGEPFRVWVREQFYNHLYRTLTYSEARRAMFNFIDNHDGAVTGVYGGLVLAISPGGNVTSPTPMNTEHTIPQSLFDRQEPMRSDIHHLYPTFDVFNNHRANFPFREIPDDQTEKWMLGTATSSNKPEEDIDRYSEAAEGRFEPRESHKGNVARSIFYFFTMYPDYALTRVGDINLLFAWHLADPVDDAERARNDAIASFQGSRNPYIDHPEWAIRAWEGIVEEEVNKILLAMGREAVSLEDGGGTGETGNEALIRRLTVLADEWEQTIREQQRILQEFRTTLERINNREDP